MKARLSVDVNSEDFEQELVKALETKMRHIAQGTVKEFLDKSFESHVQQYVESAIDSKFNKLPYAAELRLSDFVAKEVRRALTDMNIRSMINDAIQAKIDGINMKYIVEQKIAEQASSIAVEPIKKALQEVFKDTVKE